MSDSPDSDPSDQHESEVSAESADTSSTPRRGFLERSSFLIMTGGFVAGYGTLAAFAGRFLFPAQKKSENWQFVATLDEMLVGQSLVYRTPSGSNVVIARQQEADSADSFVALSSVCPHLGCAVHWESQNDRFFCPCHNGAFDPSGKATEGPPATAGQSLAKFPLKIENGLLYIAVSSETLTRSRKA